jgi:hypothetical protein
MSQLRLSHKAKASQQSKTEKPRVRRMIEGHPKEFWKLSMVQSKLEFGLAKLVHS